MNLPLQHRFADALPELSEPWQADVIPSPHLLALNDSVAADLGLDPAHLRTDSGLLQLLGVELPQDARPVAQVYAGHQFGGYSPRLGDGRAVLLGEIETSAGLRDLHLKGSGRTPLSRGGDGLAVVGPMLREFLISESLHALGVPTTRALAVIGTGRQVLREDGPLPGVILVRTAASHLRVGSFQYARASGDSALLQRLCDVAIARHVPQAAAAENPALALFVHVRNVQALLVSQWMHLGFVHGVMNSDNMTISGESIDFGPCAFMDAYDPATLFSSIDEKGRYAYGNQPPVAQWNLARLAESLLPLIAEDEEVAVALATEALEGYPAFFNTVWLGGMRAKLGLSTADPRHVNDAALTPLVGDLLTLLQESRCDWTGFWVDLGVGAAGDLSRVRDRFSDRESFDAWAHRWLAWGPDAQAMAFTNPVRIPRNHLVDEALSSAEAGDLTPFEALLAAVREPYSERTDLARYAEPAPDAFAHGFRTYCGT